jgi:protocatechuate 3,4-dioxygenase beta subunit
MTFRSSVSPPKIKNDILTFFDEDDIARYPILRAINQEDDEQARELLTPGNDIAKG